MRMIEEARILEAWELRCENCGNQQTFKWPKELASRRPEFVLCRKCFMPVSVKFDSVPHTHGNQKADKESVARVKGKLMANVLATPQNPAVTDFQPTRPVLTVQVREGQRVVSDMPLETLLSLIRDFGRQSGHLAKFGDEEASAEYAEAKRKLYEALGVKQP